MFSAACQLSARPSESAPRWNRLFRPVHKFASKLVDRIFQPAPRPGFAAFACGSPAGWSGRCSWQSGCVSCPAHLLSGSSEPQRPPRCRSPAGPAPHRDRLGTGRRHGSVQKNVARLDRVWGVSFVGVKSSRRGWNPARCWKHRSLILTVREAGKMSSGPGFPVPGPAALPLASHRHHLGQEAGRLPHHVQTAPSLGQDLPCPSGIHPSRTARVSAGRAQPDILLSVYPANWKAWTSIWTACSSGPLPAPKAIPDSRVGVCRGSRLICFSSCSLDARL